MVDLFTVLSQLAQDLISISKTETTFGSRALRPESEVPLMMENFRAAQEEFRFR